MLKWLWLSACVFLADQLGKHAAVRWLDPYEPYPFLPYFNFSLAFNEGAAFSLLSEAGGWQRWFFSALAIALSIVILFWLKNLEPREKLLATSLSFVLGGAVGNVTDRILYGKVTDFIDWYYYSSDACLPFFFRLHDASCHWPTFNLADSAIFLGAVLMILHALFSKRRR